MDAAVARIARAAKAAEKKKVKLLLENLNPEPEQAEVHYLAQRPRGVPLLLRAARFARARLELHRQPRPHPARTASTRSWPGSTCSRCGEVRLADCRGTHEEHLRPGEGTIDFGAMFAAIEASGYRGHYMQAFGSLDDMLKGRSTLAQLAEEGLK